MSTPLRQAELGACDFLDVLEEAALFRTEVTVTLRSGASFVETIREVVTDGGENHVVFEGRGRVQVAEVERVTRAARPVPR